MTDPLFARAQRAIEESQALQDQSHALQSEQVRERGELRRSGGVPPRVAGYTREAKRKIVVTEEEAGKALRQRDEARMKLRDKLNDLAKDQTEVFKPKR